MISDIYGKCKYASPMNPKRLKFQRHVAKVGGVFFCFLEGGRLFWGTSTGITLR